MDEDRLKRHDLSGGEWQRLEPLLPAMTPQRGRWADHRTVINGVFFRTRAGVTWRDLPAVYGNWKTVYNRHRRWSLDGTWKMILDRPRAGCDEAGAVTGRSVLTRPSLGPIGTPPRPSCRWPR